MHIALSHSGNTWKQFFESTLKKTLAGMDLNKSLPKDIYSNPQALSNTYQALLSKVFESAKSAETI